MIDKSTDLNSLVHAARHGEQAAFDELYRRYRNYLKLTAIRSIGSEMLGTLEASDLVQDSLLEIQRDITRFNGTDEPQFKRWLGRLLKNNVVDESRKHRTARRSERRHALIQSEGAHAVNRAPSPSTIVSRRETQTELFRAISKISPRHREIIELRHKEELSYAEIASRLSITEDNARKLWTRAISALRSQLASSFHKTSD